MKRWQKWSLISVCIVLVPAGFIASVLPGIVKSRAVQRVEAATGRKLAIGGITINPVTWTVVLRDFSFSERGGGETFVAFSSARVTLSPLSLYRWAPIIAAAHFTSPCFRIVRNGANSYNFTDLLKFLPLRPRLSVNNLTVTNGSIDFIDRGLPVEKRHEVRKIELAVPFITTMQYFADRYVTPRLSAVVNGSPFHLEGKLRPFPKAVEASAVLELKDVSIPDYLAYLPAALPVRVESGRVSAKLALNYRTAEKENPELSLSGSVTLAGVKVSDRTGAPFLALTRLDAGIDRALLLAEKFDVSSFSADGLELYLSRDKQGVWSHSRLAGRPSPGAAPRKRVLVNVKEMRFRNGRLHFVDSFPADGFTTDLEGISLDMRGYSTSPGKPASYALSFTTLRGEKGDLTGEFSPWPLMNSSSIRLSGVTLEPYYPYFAWARRGRVKGRFAAAGTLEFGGPQGLRLDKVSVRARQFSTLIGKRVGITRSLFTLDGGKYSRKENLLEVADVTLRDGELRFSRVRKEVPLPVTSLHRGGSGKQRVTAPFRYRVGRISGLEMNGFFTDGMLAERPEFALKKIAFSLEKLSGPPLAPVSFRVAGAYGKGGSLRASGSFTPAPWSLAAELALQRIPLTDFDPYLSKNLNLVVSDGRVDARLALSLAARGDRLTGSLGGSAGIRSLSCLDAEGENLLKWEHLQLDNVQWSLDPFAVNIGDVALTRFYSRIIAERDGSLNLQHLYTRKPEGEKKLSAAGGKKRTVRVGTVTLQDGTLAFTDHHVAGGYSTTLFNLGGRISGLSSEENLFADVDLRGNLENQSPLRITGQINPLRDDLFADLTVSFTDIELSPMTPYSGTYLGYAVDKGKLFLDSRYRIENRKIDSENRVFIDQLTLGKRIESGKATNLPVRLAVALLKNRKGEIRLDLPVTGQTDDPKFSIRRVVLEMLRNVLSTAAKSPFALLRLNKEDVSSVGFPPAPPSFPPVKRKNS